MATRRPLTLIQGAIRELPSGDTLPQALVEGLAAALAALVAKSGDTMTGDLTIQRTGAAANLRIDSSNSSAVLLLDKGASGSTNAINAYTNNSVRWQVNHGDGAAESGANAGSNYSINRYADNGAFLATAFSIIRSTGAIALNGPTSVTGGISATLGVTAGSGITASAGNITASNGSIRSVTNGFEWNGASLGLLPHGYAVSGVYRQNSIADCQNGQGDVSNFSSYHQPGVESFFQMNVGGSGNYFRFNNGGVGSSNNGWTTHSDVHIKKDIRRLNRVRERVMGIPAVVFKRRDDPSGRDVIGTIAQGAEGTNPEIIHVEHATHEQGKRRRRSIKAVDYAPVGVVALAGTQDLYRIIDELAARVAALESAL